VDEAAIRVVLVVLVAIAAVAIGRGADRWQRPHHPPVRLSGLDLPPGVIAFTSTQCDNCKRVMARLRTAQVPVREVTHDLESHLFAAAGIEAVPLIVVTDRAGAAVRQLAGTPSARVIRRATKKAGW
jgi:hypothetical protein